MTENKPKYLSLTLKIVLVTVLALVLGLSVFFLSYKISNHLVDKFYMSDSAVSARKAKIYTELNHYIKTNNISGKDTQAVARWSSEHAYVSIYIIDNVNAATMISGGKTESISASQYASQYGKLYPMHFSDANYQIAIVDSSAEREVFINTIVSILISAAVFLAVILSYTLRMTNRIISLSRQAYYVSNGDLDAPLASGGGDEISILAEQVDNLRNSVIDRMTGEHEAWQANSDLITAISHDIRTPMTSLIGYLDLLAEDGFEDKDRCAVFTRSAQNKATELKNLTDELFRYFLVFGNTDPKLDSDNYDGVMMFDELLGEAEFELSDLGFTIERSYPGEECTIYVDPMYLKRVIDNVVSNIKKYAEKASPIHMDIGMTASSLEVRVSNTVYAVAPTVESNKIGIKTCRRIMELMGGNLSTELSSDIFTVKISLPKRS